MDALAHTLQLSGGLALNFVIGVGLVKGIVGRVEEQTEERPSYLFVDLPAAVLVIVVSLGIWTVALA